jgi:hypothetical protein
MPALPAFRVPVLPWVAAGLMLLALPPVLARPFPPEALRGELVVTAPPEVLLNQTSQRLAPGARIRDGANRVVLSGGLAGQKLLVHYTRFPDGQLRDVWLLTAAEAARQPWPRTPAEAAAWRFDPPSQTWTKP